MENPDFLCTATYNGGVSYMDNKLGVFGPLLNSMPKLTRLH